MSLPIIFGYIRHPAPQEYADHVLSSYLPDHEQRGAVAQLIARRNIDTVLPYLQKESFPILSDSQQKLIGIKQECFLKEVTETSRLYEGETVKDDFFSVLTEDRGEFAAGTPVLVRETNFATIYYLYPAYIFESGTLRALDSLYPDTEKTMFVEALAIQMLTSFASALASKVGQAVGQKILNVIFPDDKQLTPQELLESIKDLVRNANIEQTVSEQTGYVNAAIAQLKGYYEARKQSGESREKLYDWLVEREVSVVNAINILAQDAFREKGIPAYFLAVNTVFVILQEMCLQDPLQQNPVQSSNYELIKKEVVRYAGTAQQTIGTLIEKRLKAITPVKMEAKSRGDFGHVTVTIFYSFSDTFDGDNKFSKMVDNPKKEEEVRIEMERRRDSYIASKKAEFDWMYTIVKNWEELKITPIPEKTQEVV